MENDSHAITYTFRKYSYRHLQQLSKHYGLPANYKRLYLIQLIIAKKLGLEESVKAIIEKVTEERKSRKNSKNITLKSQMKTKLARNMTDIHISKYNTRQSVLARLMNADTPKNLDAHKTLKQYKNLSLRKYQKPTNQLVDEQIHNVKLKSQCIMKYQVNGDIIMRKDNVKLMYNTSSTHTIAPLPAKRQRILSDPIKPYPILKLQKADLTLRRNDGTVSKINAFIQEKPPPTNEIRDVLQDLERNNSEHNYIQRNMSIDSAFCEANNSIETNDGIEIMYNDKLVKQTKYETYKEKIEDVFTKFSVTAKSGECSSSTYMPQTTVQNIQLETIYNFKSPFTNSSLLQMSTKNNTTCTYSTKTVMSTKVYPTSTAISHNAYPRYDVNCANGTHHVDMLLCKEPMQQPDNSDLNKNIAGYDVNCANGTHHVDMLLCKEPMQQPDNSDLNKNIAGYDVNCANGTHHVDMLLCKEPMQQPDNSDLNKNIAESSETTSFDRNDGNITISEMLEDALEVISQDEDYINCVDREVTNFDMDVDGDLTSQTNCVLCNWYGPGIVLDHHMKKIHENEVMKQVTNDWNITFTLGELVQEPLWCSRVLEYESIFYVLSVKYEEPDVFMATLTSHSTDFTFKTGSITVLNKTTGEPFTWEGEIKCLPPDWPYSKNINGLKINLSKLDLLPQIYPIAGQPGLNDVDIILSARLYN